MAIVGSRGFSSLELVDQFVKKLPNRCSVVSGGAVGVDTRAAIAAHNDLLQVIIHRPDWSVGKHAGLLRNDVIVSNCDVLVAFWDGVSTGTAYTIKAAFKAGKPVIMIDEEGSVHVRQKPVEHSTTPT